MIAPDPRGGASHPPALELQGLSKAFGPIQAVADVSLDIEAGSIAGIVGENGAGKSTLMNLVYGLHPADAGRILVDGRAGTVASPQDALRLGIGMVHQHFMLVDTFTVLENIVLGREGGPILGSALRIARRELQRLSDAYGMSVDLDAIAGDLPVGDQQRIEILKALYRRARILILDEPTAVLTPQEADRLFAVLRELAAAGATIVLITHKLREILELTDTVFVMRRGRLVARRATAGTNAAELAELMIGGSLPPAPPRARRKPGQTLLSGTDLLAQDPGRAVPGVEGVDIDLHAGEIVGIAGVSGNGQGELLELLAGMRPLSGGLLRVGHREITAARPAGPAEMRRLGVAHVPEHRHRHGIVGEFEAAETSILGYQAMPELGGAFLDGSVIAGRCRGLMERFDVRPAAPAVRSANLSGGNQQKLVMAREVAAEPRILLIGQPTRGVDIGAIAAIHAELRALRDDGCAILLVSAELDEIIALADRILVMSGGRLTGAIDAAAADPATLGLMMSGAAASSAGEPGWSAFA